MLRAGADDLVATGGLLDPLLHGMQLLLERGVFIGPAEHGLQVADGGRAAAVAKGAHADQFECRGAKAVVGHDDGGNVGSDQSRAALDALAQRVAVGIQVEDQNIALARDGVAADGVSAGLHENVELLAEGRREERMERAVLGVEANARQFRVHVRAKHVHPLGEDRVSCPYL